MESKFFQESDNVSDCTARLFTYSIHIYIFLVRFHDMKQQSRGLSPRQRGNGKKENWSVVEFLVLGA